VKVEVEVEVEVEEEEPPMKTHNRHEDHSASYVFFKFWFFKHYRKTVVNCNRTENTSGLQKNSNTCQNFVYSL
jgi:hypothetical protein